MKVLFGIGNPGTEYSNTRHNIGFTILDAFAYKHKLKFSPAKGEYFFAKGKFGGKEFLLVKPTTYVNRSGIAASDVLERYEIDLGNFLVISDDINLPVGKIRLQQKGGDGGHNGLASIIYYLESNEFPRLRFGVGSNFEHGQMANYVLSPFEEDELEIIEPQIELAVELLEKFVTGGMKTALDFFSKVNAVKKKEE